MVKRFGLASISDTASQITNRAVAYVRMSTERQEYSTKNQLDVIEKYATEHDLSIVAIYEDAGKSGLTKSGRPALCRLIEDVQTRHDFDFILVYDVTRWGRFQDIDESAYYEYHCRRHGVSIAYCAEPFDNDGSPYSAIMKMLKRAAAAEFSRELSVKVFAGQCRLIRMGYKAGGAAIYGLSRLLVGKDGIPVGILKSGEWKAIQNQRVIFAPGPEEEIEIVNLIFKWYVDDGVGDRRIAALLNSQNVPSKYGGKWTNNIIRCMLKNEKYIGNLIFNKASFKLKNKAISNPPESWVRCDNAFPAIVPIELYDAAQRERRRRNGRYSTEELIAILRRIYREKGRISSNLINQDPDAPTATLFWCRFGGMFEAYKLAGIPHVGNDEELGVRKRNYAFKDIVQAQVEKLVRAAGGYSERQLGHWATNTYRMRLNGLVNIAIRVLSCRHEPKYGYNRWWVNSPSKIEVDFLIAAQLDKSNTEIVRYFLFPREDFGMSDIAFTEDSVGRLQSYSTSRLEDFFGPIEIPESKDDSGVLWAS